MKKLQQTQSQVLKNCFDEPYDLADTLAERTHSHVVQIVQTEPLSASDLKKLKKDFSCVSNISLVRNLTENQEVKKYDRRKLTDDELFKKFYKDARGFEPSQDLIEMFNLCKGDNNETD